MWNVKLWICDICTSYIYLWDWLPNSMNIWLDAFLAISKLNWAQMEYYLAEKIVFDLCFLSYFYLIHFPLVRISQPIWRCISERTISILIQLKCMSYTVCGIKRCDVIFTSFSLERLMCAILHSLFKTYYLQSMMQRKIIWYYVFSATESI